MNPSMVRWFVHCAAGCVAATTALFLAITPAPGVYRIVLAAVLSGVALLALGSGVPLLVRGSREEVSRLVEEPGSDIGPPHPVASLGRLTKAVVGLALLSAAGMMLFEAPAEIERAVRLGDGRLLSYLVLLVVSLLISVGVGGKFLLDGTIRSL